MKRPSPSMTVALLALFVALGGTATAAKVLIDSSSQIKDRTIKRQDLANGAIVSKSIRDGAITADDLAKSASPGQVTVTATEGRRIMGPANVPDKQGVTIATLSDLKPGAYAIFAKTTLTPDNDNQGLLGEGGSLGGFCFLDANGDSDEARTLFGGPGSRAPSTMNLQLTRTFGKGGGSVKLSCGVDGQKWRAANTSIIALKVSGAPQIQLNG